MKNETEKLNKFKHAVFESAENDAAQIIEKAEKQRDAEVTGAELEAENTLKTRLLDIDKQCAARSVREVSSRRLDTKRAVLSYRSMMIDKVFKNVADSVEQFCKSREYENYLTKKLNECSKQFAGQKGCAYFSLRDEALGEKVCAGTDFSCGTKETIELGGVMIVYEEQNLAFDYTLDYAFEQERENFSKSSGLALKQGERQ